MSEEFDREKADEAVSLMGSDSDRVWGYVADILRAGPNVEVWRLNELASAFVSDRSVTYVERAEFDMTPSSSYDEN